MNDELKVRSFRISEDISDKFKSICGEFENQNTALTALINAYEVQSARTVLVNRQTDISDYDTHIQAIQSLFLHSLEINANAEERIRAEYERQLISKDNTIADLQDSLLKAENVVRQAQEQASMEIEQAHETINNSKAEFAELKERTERAEKAAMQSETTLKAVQDSKTLVTDNLKKAEKEIDDLKSGKEKILAEFEENKKENQSLVKEVSMLKAQLTACEDKCKKEISTLRFEAEMEKEKLQLGIEKAIVAEQKKSAAEQKRLSDELNKRYSEIDELRNQIMELKK